MPRTIPQSQIVQPGGNRHHHVPDRVAPVAEFVPDDATALHAPNRVLNPHFLTRNTPVCFLLFGCAFTAARFLCWLLDRYVDDREPLKAHILIQDASNG